MTDEPTFARLVSLACHDLRTPLATVNGFARTLERTVQLDQPADRYVEMIVAAAAQLAELLDELSLVARIEAGRYDPHLQAADSLQIAQGCVERLGADRVTVEGRGADVLVDIQPTERGVSALVQALLRHGGLDEVQVHVQGADLGVAPVTESSAKVVLGQDLRDLGAACAVRLIDRLGGEVAVEGSVLRIRLPRP
ncbi:MAG: histidine kinase dimerization/phospho-acceptor domain-containing protein [Gaiellaceae bacterium]